MAEHRVLAGRFQLSVDPAHGPGAVARNARSRFGQTAAANTPSTSSHEIEIRDLAVYEQLLEVA